MGQPYVGEIRMFGGNFAPAGWAFCDGAIIPISENETLFNLIGTTYGGDGQETFQLPNLSSRVPIHMGTGPDGTTYQLAETGGVEEVTLTVQQIPTHTHTLHASKSGGNTNSPTGGVLATPPSLRAYSSDAPDTVLAPMALGSVGGAQPHTNLQPYLTVNFIISLYGVFPSPT